MATNDPSETEAQSPVRGWIGTICTVLTMVATVVGAFVVLQQVPNLVRTRREELVSKLYATDIDLNKLLLDRPNVRRALFDDPKGKVFETLGEKEKSETDAMCQMFGDLLESSVVLRLTLVGTGENMKAALAKVETSAEKQPGSGAQPERAATASPPQTCSIPNLANEPGSWFVYCWDHYLQYFWTNSYAFRSYIVKTRDTWTPAWLGNFKNPDFCTAVADFAPKGNEGAR
jgi:hypothetical protein